MSQFPPIVIALQEEQQEGLVVVLDSPGVGVALAPSQEYAIAVADRGPQGNPSTVPGPQGPTGPTGPQGPTGSAGAASGFTYTQGVASSVWTIVHNLNRYPSVTVIDSAGEFILCGPQYQDVNTVVLTFGSAFGGIAYLI